MRLFPYILTAVMLLAMGAGVYWRTNTTRSEVQRQTNTQSETIRFQQQVYLQAAMASVDDRRHRHPATIDPAWFEDDRPTNHLLDASHPWVEVDESAPSSKVHPDSPIAGDLTVASFWYNPSNGIVRARVPASISDAHALALYNAVNESNLAHLYVRPERADEPPAATSLDDL